jgi:hypothetical protein
MSDSLFARHGVPSKCSLRYRQPWSPVTSESSYAEWCEHLNTRCEVGKCCGCDAARTPLKIITHIPPSTQQNPSRDSSQTMIHKWSFVTTFITPYNPPSYSLLPPTQLQLPQNTKHIYSNPTTTTVVTKTFNDIYIVSTATTYLNIGYKGDTLQQEHIQHIDKLV